MGLKLDNSQDCQVAGFCDLNDTRVSLPHTQLSKYETISLKEEIMKNKIKGLSLLVAALMLTAIATPVFAQSETDPVGEPAPVEEVSSFMDHPIVKLLAGFFANLFAPPVIELPDGQVVSPTEPEGEPAPGEEPLVEEIEPLPEPLPVVVPEEAIAALHEEQNLGFGEMTKLLQITVEAQAACALEGINCDVTLDSLVAEYKAGAGMGELFKKYEKPEYMGVGQVRKAANPNVKSNNGKAKGKK